VTGVAPGTYHDGVKNFEIARLFYEIASLLEVQNESVFRVRAYQRGAQTLEALAEDVEAVARRGQLTKLPGIGRDLASAIEEYLATGTIRRLDGMRGGFPPGFLALLEIRGLGPKTAKALWEALGVDSVARLEELCRSGQVIGHAGIREKSCENILRGIAIWKAGHARTPLGAARAITRQVVEVLRAHAGVERVEVAGSLRRMRETVKDIDLLVTSEQPARVVQVFTTMPAVVDVVARGDTRASIRHQDGIQIDVRVVAPEAFGAALQYFTGSRDHNVRTREIAQARGLRLSEYGVFEEATGRRVAGTTEDDVYAAIGLPWIPPELRENGGEIEAARAGALPTLVTVDDIRGDLHAHTNWSDGHLSIEKLVETAQSRGHEYIIVSDHSKTSAIAGGLGADELAAQIEQIRALQGRFTIRILAGTECDILADGAMDLPDDLLARCDVVLAAVHSRYKQDRDAMTRRIVQGLSNPWVNILVHPTGRLIGSRDPYDVDLEAVFAAARAHGKAVEINCSPDRLDLGDVHARRAAALGIPLAISTDTHYASNLELLPFGIGVARRAWVTPAQVLNSRPVGELLRWARPAP
jgi:DNA polymerase (family 10)